MAERKALESCCSWPSPYSGDASVAKSRVTFYTAFGRFWPESSQEWQGWRAGGNAAARGAGLPIMIPDPIDSLTRVAFKLA